MAHSFDSCVCVCPHTFRLQSCLTKDTPRPALDTEGAVSKTSGNSLQVSVLWGQVVAKGTDALKAYLRSRGPPPAGFLEEDAARRPSDELRCLANGVRDAETRGVLDLSGRADALFSLSEDDAASICADLAQDDGLLFHTPTYPGLQSLSRVSIFQERAPAGGFFAKKHSLSLERQAREGETL